MNDDMRRQDGATDEAVTAAAGVEVSPERWLLPDRAGFADWVNSVFTYPTGKNDDDDDVVSLFPQQRMVRDFLQPDSPYAGLVLYHAVGVGKSCAALAAVRALESHFRVIVILPASLQVNFVNEARKCGGPMYSERQEWSRSQDGSWIAASSSSGDDGEINQKKVHFDDMTIEDREAVRAQLNHTIRSRMRFINYNGLTKKNVEELTSGAVNMFENAVVVVDEAHNFVSSVMHAKLVSRLYEHMMTAKSRKVILLTGTPFMNSVMELPYLVNLAAGMKTVIDVSFVARPGARDSVEKTVIDETYRSCAFVNRAVVRQKGNRLVVSAELTPSGFTRAIESDGRPGVFVTRASASYPVLTTEQSIDILREVVASVPGVNDAKGDDASTRRTLLLPVGPEFVEEFVSDAGFSLKNVDALARRIAGTVSYFGAYDPAMYPVKSRVTLVKCPMSEHQFNEYKVLRDKERRQERAASERTGDTAAIARNSLVPGTEDASGATYRSSTRQACNFVFPEDMHRPSRKTSTTDRQAGTTGTASITTSSSTTPYDLALAAAIETLRSERRCALTLTPTTAATTTTQTHPIRVGGEHGSRPSSSLWQHSPKFATILRHLGRAPSGFPVLIYSSFRTAEGVGLLSATMDVNGYGSIRVYRDHHSGDVRVAISDGNGKVTEPGTTPSRIMRYMILDNQDPLTTGVIIDIFNADFSKIPASAFRDVEQEVHRLGGGRIASILFITQIGADGINLKAVREVHALEPFWHAIRFDQVVGRAVRAHSHSSLPENERRVDMFMYLATFTPHQLQVDQTLDRLDGGMTTDQTIFALTQKKQKLVEQMLDVLKAAAVDCQIHRHMHQGERYRCTTRFRNLGPYDFAYGFDAEDDRSRAPGTRLVAVRRQDGQMFYVDTDHPDRRYDYEALKLRGQLIPVV